MVVISAVVCVDSFTFTHHCVLQGFREGFKAEVSISAVLFQGFVMLVHSTFSGQLNREGKHYGAVLVVEGESWRKKAESVTYCELSCPVA